eukprot:scaffold109535_cov19-Tisochrysis_lutea.AAC.1
MPSLRGPRVSRRAESRPFWCAWRQAPPAPAASRASHLPSRLETLLVACGRAKTKPLEDLAGRGLGVKAPLRYLPLSRSKWKAHEPNSTSTTLSSRRHGFIYRMRGGRPFVPGDR